MVEKLEWKNFGWSWLETWRQLRPMLSRYNLYWTLFSPAPLFSEADLTLTWGDKRSGEAAAPWLDRDRVPAQWDT